VLFFALFRVPCRSCRGGGSDFSPARLRAPRGATLHRAGQPRAERFHRKLEPEIPRRKPELKWFVSLKDARKIAEV